MDTVEIKLNSFRYRFRRLTWIEEARIEFPPGVDQREIVLAHALHDASGFPIASVDDALRVLRKIPTPLRWRMWILYRGKLPADRYYSAGEVYDAPDRKTYDRKLIETGDSAEPVLDTEDDLIARRYGHEEAQEARSLKRAMLEQAQRSGTLRPAAGETHA